MLDFRPCNYIEYIPRRRKLFDIFFGLPEGKEGLIKSEIQFISDAGVKAIYAKI